MTDIDDDFQEPVRVNLDKKSLRAFKKVKKPFYTRDNFKKPQGWVDLPIKYDETYLDIDNATNLVTEWAEKQHMILVKKKSTQTTRYLTCKFSSRYDTKKTKESSKRLTSSYKTDCPFIIRFRKIEENGVFSWSLTEPKNGDRMEYTHNHPCTLKYNSITPEGKKRLFTQDDVKNVVEMVENRTSIPEIRKNISKFNGLPVFEYQDMANLVNSLKRNIKPNSRIDDARVLVDKMKNAGYTVRYQVSQTKDGDPLMLKDIFFANESMVDNAKKLGQVFIIDATYKTSRLEMPLVSVYGVHNILGKDMQLKSLPVAYAFVSQESMPSYKWFLQCLKDLGVCSSNEVPVFVTDKCMALMKALDIVFPDSSKNLCTWHMMNNFKKNLNRKGWFKCTKAQKAFIVLVEKMINTKSKDSFKKYLPEYMQITSDPEKIGDYEEFVPEDDGDDIGEDVLKGEKEARMDSDFDSDEDGQLDEEVPSVFNRGSFKAKMYMLNYWYPIRKKWAV